MPRSLAASAEETVHLLSAFAERSGRQGAADRLARQRLARMQASTSARSSRGPARMAARLYRDNAALDQAIASSSGSADAARGPLFHRLHYAEPRSG
jgi:uncharacterized alpha-E superfamily protein